MPLHPLAAAVAAGVMRIEHLGKANASAGYNHNRQPQPDHPFLHKHTTNVNNVQISIS